MCFSGSVDECIQQNILKDVLIKQRVEGAQSKLVDQVRKKIAKGKSPAAIANELEEPIEIVHEIIKKQALKSIEK